MTDLSSPLSLKPTERRTLADSVKADILAELRRRDLRPGTKIPSERELQHALGVGRSTIREALNGLGAMGVIEIRHGQGAFVIASPAVVEARESLTTALNRALTMELIEARMTVEAEVFRLAAERRSAEDLEEMDAILDRCEVAFETGQPSAPPGVDFHLAIARAAHNDVLAGFVASISHLMVERGPELEAVEGYREWELADHRRLGESIRAGDPDRAAQAMRSHLDGVVRYYADLEREAPTDAVV